MSSLETQAWPKGCAPRGNGFLSGQVIHPDHPAMTAWHIAKSSYQLRPDVFQLDWLSRATGIEQPEIAARIRRLCREHLIVLVMNPAVQTQGFGLYYWFVKLRESARGNLQLGDWRRRKDSIATSYDTEGAFDFLDSAHIRVLDNLLRDVIIPQSCRPEVESLRLCPVRREIRQEHIHSWDAPGDLFRTCTWGADELSRLAAHQQALDAADIQIWTALNQARPISDYFDFSVLAGISGLDPAELEKGLVSAVEEQRMLLPVVLLNWQKLGITQHIFAVRLFPTTSSARKTAITDALASHPQFHTVLEFSDAWYDFVLMACSRTVDLDTLRRTIEVLPEVVQVDEAEAVHQSVRWGCRLDDQNGWWEECLFPDDLLRDDPLSLEMK